MSEQQLVFICNYSKSLDMSYNDYGSWMLVHKSRRFGVFITLPERVVLTEAGSSGSGEMLLAGRAAWSSWWLVVISCCWRTRDDVVATRDG